MEKIPRPRNPFLNNCTLDKVTVIGKLTDDTYKCNIAEYLMSRLDYDTECRTSYRDNTYRYCFVCRPPKTKEGTFTLFYTYNGGYNGGLSEHAFKAEFNPNKEGVEIWLDIVSKFRVMVHDITKLDLAFDFYGYEASSVNYSGRCDTMSYGNATTRTLYIAPKAENHRVKIYQKDLERAKLGIDMAKCTRVEMTLRTANCDLVTRKHVGDLTELSPKMIELLTTACDRLACISFPSYESQDPIVYALLNLNIQQRQNMLALMSPNTRRKYQRLVSENETLTINVDPIELHEHITRQLYYQKITTATSFEDTLKRERIF